MQGAGVQTAGIVAGGGTPGNTAEVEHYDGSSWSEETDINTARGGPSMSGTQTACLAFGGNDPTPGYEGLTEEWNGTSWTEIADLSVGRYHGSGSKSGSTDAALMVGGYIGGDPDSSNATEEFNDPSIVTWETT